MVGRKYSMNSSGGGSKHGSGYFVHTEQSTAACSGAR